jgi:hypothetical protein
MDINSITAVSVGCPCSHRPQPQPYEISPYLWLLGAKHCLDHLHDSVEGKPADQLRENVLNIGYLRQVRDYIGNPCPVTSERLEAAWNRLTHVFFKGAEDVEKAAQDLLHINQVHPTCALRVVDRRGVTFTLSMPFG